MGYSISYDKVKLFKQLVAVKKILSTQDEVSPAFTQWVSDNCNHKAAMLDGRGTFHLMGIIECDIKKGRFENKPIKRIKHILKNAKVTKTRQIKTHWYSFPDHWPLAKALLRLASTVAAKLTQLVLPKSYCFWYSVAIFQNVPQYGSRLNSGSFLNLPHKGMIIHCHQKSQCFHLSTRVWMMRAAYTQLCHMS